MKYKSVWTIPPEETPPMSAENVAEIMQEQAQDLANRTHNAVLASFYLLPSCVSEDDMAERDYNLPYSSGREHEDAGGLYDYQRYAFDIYNYSYMFRLFVMDLSPYYPAYLSVDREVLREAQEMFEISTVRYPGISRAVKVDSNENLLDTLEKLISTRKVQFMLYKLRQQSEEAEKKGA